MTNPAIHRYLVDWRNRMANSVNSFENLQDTESPPEISESVVSRNMKFLGYEYLSVHPDCTFDEFEAAMLSVGSPVEGHIVHLKHWHSWKVNFFHRVFLEAYIMWQIINKESHVFYGSDRAITDQQSEEAHTLNTKSIRDMLPTGIVAVKLPDYVAAGYFCAVFFVPGFYPVGLGRRGIVILDFLTSTSMRSTALSVKIAIPTFTHAVAYVQRTIKELYA